MDKHPCSTCNIKPELRPYDELWIMYYLVCPRCGKETHHIICKSATLDNPHCDEETETQLTIEWNKMNTIKPFQIGI